MLKIDTHAHYLPRDWPDLAAKYGDVRFPVIHHGDDGRHRIYKDGKFFREIWPKTWDPEERIADYARFGDPPSSFTPQRIRCNDVSGRG